MNGAIEHRNRTCPACNSATVSAFLNSRTRIEYADVTDARRDQPGRWYPN
jgi:hypothetical protein